MSRTKYVRRKKKRKIGRKQDVFCDNLSKRSEDEMVYCINPVY